ncbi:CocE/NonD family hydrolase [Sciscionella sediminilitoris]|uniref:CocE/NonD family hydrolase n=1 Tax=Sciscionella sediminilitoris TaxID=1445613 RepID=UPI0004DF2264|nr:CocE/NonD family hydrolase [Sciscionella sp. SE31]
MREVTELPHAVHEEQQVRIPLADGTRLSGRIWRPVDAEEHPVPAILEFIPYRARDLTAVRDSVHHPYLAGHGYAGVRVDLRGSGDSEGVLTDEYLEQELCDAEEVLDWLADQSWCNGRTGMMGISWGGFNALQVAARRPRSLGAIVTACSSDDRYTDDVHYMGGCLLSDNLSWASTMFAYNACPPDPRVVGQRWQRMWHERLENSGLWLETWLRHQYRDDYWRHGSICEDYTAIDVPVMAVSGWADGYSNAVLRMMAELAVPRKGLIGPWSHKYPHLGEPGPAIGFLQELVQWWDHWLKDADNGAMDGPMLRTWMQDSVPPSTSYERRPGRWVGDPGWPSPLVTDQRYALSSHRIAPAGEPGEDTMLTVESPLSVGQFGGKWCSYNAPPDLPYDQREEDGGSLVFDTEPLEAPCEILGTPVLELECSVDRPVAMLAARLSDVAPDGRATRVSYGLLNLTHRYGHDQPEPLEPGHRYRVRVPLNGVAQTFPAGHRIRLSLSSSYWPLAWPPPEPVCISVYTKESCFSLPVREQNDPDEPEVTPFDEPEGAKPVEVTRARPGSGQWRVSRDLVDYDAELHVVKDSGGRIFEDIGLEVDQRVDERYTWTGDDFHSVRGDVRCVTSFAREDWATTTVTRTILSSDQENFHLHAELDAYEDQQRTVSLNWQHTIPRKHL